MTAGVRVVLQILADLSACDTVLNPEKRRIAASGWLNVRFLIAQAMRKAGRIEIQAKVMRFGPFHPSLKVLWLNSVAF